ncbi:hypothetical protein LTR84_004677 [Exophiala bonariae]|uniref:Starter acyltransferase (SAT) domain-containing protein n=1 Tax=Exophiala bonariae TaxID=1690606 RepID=A0AAV9NMU6_9EURO|nr:hypothetical protein LTR84_004677 [Exophiala bonariae]
MFEATSATLDKVGLIATWAGIFCPLTKQSDVLSALVQDAIAVQHAWENKSKTSGIFSAQFEAASAVVASLGAYLIGAAVVAALPEEAAIAAVAAAAEGLGEAYGLFCQVVSRGGEALTAASHAAESIAHSSLCPQTSSKRSTGKRVPYEVVGSTHRTLVARNVSYNPCSEFLSYFRIDFSLPAQLDSVCTDVEAYSQSDTLSSDLANATAVMQSFCSPYQSSGNSTLAMEFADILTAFQNAKPFCDYSIVQTTNNSTTTSSLGTSTRSSTTSTYSVEDYVLTRYIYTLICYFHSKNVFNFNLIHKVIKYIEKVINSTLAYQVISSTVVH